MRLLQCLGWLEVLSERIVFELSLKTEKAARGLSGGAVNTEVPGQHKVIQLGMASVPVRAVGAADHSGPRMSLDLLSLK